MLPGAIIGCYVWVSIVSFLFKRVNINSIRTIIKMAKLSLIHKKNQVPMVRKMDNSLHRINHYPADSVVYFVDTYPLDCDLSGG